MRFATFNILNGRVPTDQHVSLDGLVESVKRLDPDVLALQEVDHNQHRSDHADLTAIAADAMGAREHRFVAALAGSHGATGATWLAATGEEHPDSAAYGIALLSRYPVHGWEVIRLAPVPVPVPMRFGGRLRPYLVRDEPRVAVVAASVVKGLEYDHVVAVEPAAIVEAEERGLHRLYVVVTRAVAGLEVVHGRPLPF